MKPNLPLNTTDQKLLGAILEELVELNKNLKGLAKAGPSSSRGKGDKPKPKASPKKEATPE